jgi:hypothetical protein
MSDKANTIRTGTVEVKFVDGSLHTLPVHGLGQVELLVLVDELGFSDFQELLSSEATLQKIRLVNRVVARALTFAGKDVWDLERIQNSFADVNELAKIFLACVSLSNFPQASPSTASAQKPRQATVKKPGERQYG